MPHLPVRTHVRRTCACVGAALLLASCSDRGSVVAPASPPQALISTDGSRGIQIDETDTWLAVEIEMQSVSTVTSTTAFTDPTTGNQTTSLTVASPEESMTLSGGYNADGIFQGSLVVSLDPDPNANPADQVRQTSFSGEVVTNYNGYGQVMSNTLSDGSPVPSVVSEDLFYTEGEMLDGVVIEDPIVFSRTDPYGGGGSLEQPEITAALSMSGGGGGGGGRRRVEKPNDSTVVVVDELDESLLSGETGSAGASLSRASVNGAPGSQGARTTVARTFRKRGKVHLLENIRLEREDVTAQGSAKQVQTMRYKNVRWNRNSQKDKQRVDRRNARAGANRHSLGGPRSVVMLTEQCLMDSYDYSSVDTCGGGDPYLPPPPPPPASTTEWGSRTNAGRYVVFQHGFAQSENYYFGSRAWNDITGRMAIVGADATQTDYGAQFQDQAAALAVQVPQRKAIYVGHSNGGIVSRQLARQRPDLVEGIISVSSPHQGVPILRVEQGLSNMVGPFIFVINTVGCKWFGSRAVCGAFDNGPSALFSRIVGGDGRPVPVWGQERYSDPLRGPYLYNLNNTTETFQRVGIEQHTRQRWLLWRVFADQNYYCNGVPCGRQRVADMDNWYGGLRAATVVRWTWNPFKLAGRVARAAVAGTTMAATNGADAAANLAMGGGDRSDGLVPFGSQRYPNQSGARVIVNNADSHNASAYSPPAVEALRNTLRVRFGVTQNF